MSQKNSLKFTVLAENHEACGLECEHGLSILIEYKDKKYLLDAGQSGVSARNAEKMGINLAEVDRAFLSHAHYDHADGFEEFFYLNGKAAVYAREEGKLQDCYSVKKNGAESVNDAEKTKRIPYDKAEGEGYTSRYIGISPDILQKFPERFVWINTRKELDVGVWLIPHSTQKLEEIGERTGMYRLSQENVSDIKSSEMQKVLIPDCFDHEQSLVFETGSGLVIFNSCSHGGVANIVEEVRQALPGKQICAYIGGFHLKAPGVQDAMNCTEQEVEKLGRSLLDLGIKEIYTGHCTGEHGFEILSGVMGEKLKLLKTGISRIIV